MGAGRRGQLRSGLRLRLRTEDLIGIAEAAVTRELIEAECARYLRAETCPGL